MKNKHFHLLIFLLLYAGLNAQVDFGVKISDWDGFGFNYVERLRQGISAEIYIRVFVL